MRSQSMKALMLILLVSIGSCQMGGLINNVTLSIAAANANTAQFSGVTVTIPAAAAPTVATPTTVTTPAQTTFFMSKKPEYISFLDDTTDSTFTGSTYSSAATPANKLTVTGTPFVKTGVTGLAFKTSTVESLNCLAFGKTGTSVLVKYDSVAATITEVTSTAFSAYAAADWAKLVLKADCAAVTVDGVLKSLTAGALATITVPTGWINMPTTDSIAFGVTSAGVLYRYSAGSYTSIYTFASASTVYSFKAVSGRLIVTGLTYTTPGATAADVKINYVQTYYIFNDPAGGTLTLLNSFAITGSHYYADNAAATTAAGASVANDLLIPIIASPKLNRLVVVYVPATGTATTPRTTLLKSIDYTKGTVTDITFLTTTQIGNVNAKMFGVKARGYQIAISDNFLVVRNSTAYAVGATGYLAVEEAYQFVGNLAIYMRTRTLTADVTVALTDPEIQDIQGLFIDPLFPNDLTVINTFSTGGFKVKTVPYGNIASVKMITQPAQTPYITFTSPNSATAVLYSAIGGLGWAYKNPVTTGGATTTASSYWKFTPNVTNNFYTTTVAAESGTWTIKAINPDCHIETDGTIYRFVTRTVTGATPALVITNIVITTNLAGITLDGSTVYRVSQNCQRINVNDKFFKLNAAGTGFEALITAALTNLAVDANFDVALATDGVYYLNATSAAATKVQSLTLSGTCQVYQLYLTKLIVVNTAATTAKVWVYAINNQTGTYTSILALDRSAYYTAATTPTVFVSPQLTKLLIKGSFGAGGAATGVMDAFNLNYTGGTYDNITVPVSMIIRPLDTFVYIHEKFLYVRTTSTGSPTAQEIIWYINQDVKLLIASAVTLPDAQVTGFLQAAFLPDPNGAFFFLPEVKTGAAAPYTHTVQRIQISAQQAIVNAVNANSAVVTVTATVTSAGVAKVCAPGCTECASGACTACGNGWVFSSASAVCMRCGPGCSACSATNNAVCSTCFPGSFLAADKTCTACLATCKTCADATTCASCNPGALLVGTACSGTCPRNCVACSDATTCTACVPGFVLTSATPPACRNCGPSCSSCTENDILTCTACADGLQLISGKCVSCPSSCLSCNNGTCATCINGMVPNTNGVCILGCQLPCQTCADNQPTVCTSCYSGATLSGSTCAFDYSCNAVSKCTDCGQGFNGILVGNLCAQCPAIDNCIQCSTTSTSTCAICSLGYFVNTDGGCTACSANCGLCISSALCTACNTGYFIALGSQGQCIACATPCATCLSSKDYCLSCVSGYTKNGRKCLKNTYVGFTFTLKNGADTLTVAQVLANVDAITTSILTAISETTNNAGVTFSSCKLGSVVVSGSVEPATATPDAATAAITAAAANSATFAGGAYTVLSSSVSVVNTDSGSKDDKTPLIVGLVVGLGCFAIIVVVVIVVVYKKKQAAQHQVSGEQLDVKVHMKEGEHNDSIQEIGGKKK